MKIATWNVNSLRVRLPQVLDWLVVNQPDVLGMQEIKIEDCALLASVFEDIGYKLVCNGQKAYNGVAFAGKLPGRDCLTDPPGFDDPQRRILAAEFGGVRVVNLYVPNGGSVGSDKYAYKLDWLRKIAAFIGDEMVKYPKLAVLGDFNVAPEDRDVYDPDAWREQVLCSTPERQAFRELLALGLGDAFRKFEQPDASYSWWDYRAVCFIRNWGLRLDHILASPALLADCVSCRIDKSPRKLVRPSDHAPVVAEFKDV